MQKVNILGLILLILIASYTSCVYASNLIVEDSYGSSIDGLVFKKNYEHLKQGENINRLRYERMDVFNKRRKNAKEKFDRFIAKSYRFIFTDVNVTFDWGSGIVTYILQSPIPLNMPKSYGPSKDIKFSHPITNDLGEELQAFPNMVSIQMTVHMTSLGYADVYHYDVTYIGKKVYSK